MKTTNLDLFDKNKLPVFILTYIGLEYFIKWSEIIRSEPTNVQFVVVDNGSQDISKLKVPTFQTSQNVGCAGGWNVISQVAFNYFSLDKIIIGQDDAVFDLNMLLDVWRNTNDDTIAGAYDRSFEFSLFGLTKKLWNTVGMFDENFIYVGCEDNDYKHRMKLFNKTVKSLGYSADMNSNMSSRFITTNAKPANEYNVNFIEAKWGRNYEYTTPFNEVNIQPDTCGLYTGIIDVYGDISEFPSITEVKLL